MGGCYMVRIAWQRRVAYDGWHNAFTDLCRWRDSYWLVYRRGSTHVSPDGGIVVLRSVDLERWHEVTVLKTLGDDRDPKLCPTTDRLYVYFGTWLPRPEGWPDERFGPLISHVSSTDDGVKWSDPVPLYERNVWLWRIRVHDDTLYCAAYGWEDPRHKEQSFLELLVSKDGVSWEKHCRIADIEDQPDESDLLFRLDGELWCITRSTRKPDHSLFYISNPPYRVWERVDLGVTIHAPVICESQGKVFVAGRRRTDAPWIPQTTPLGNTGLFLVKRGAVEPILAFPSDGDAAYPGMVSPEAGRLIISYYSQHAYRSGVIQGISPHASDVYVAEIILDT